MCEWDSYMHPLAWPWTVSSDRAEWPGLCLLPRARSPHSALDLVGPGEWTWPRDCVGPHYHCIWMILCIVLIAWQERLPLALPKQKIWWSKRTLLTVSLFCTWKILMIVLRISTFKILFRSLKELSNLNLENQAFV